MYEVNLWNLDSQEKELWQARQYILSSEIFYTRIVPLIGEIANKITFEGRGYLDIKERLDNFTRNLIKISLAEMIKGQKENPIHHHFQVLESMLRATEISLPIVTEYSVKKEFLCESEVKKRIALALLHDIGDAEATKEKIKTSQIREVTDQIVEIEKKSNLSEQDIENLSNFRQKARDIVQKAIDFRLEHMEKGADIAKDKLKGNLPEDAIKEVCEVIKIHDNPTIAFILDEFGGYAKEGVSIKDFLFFRPKHNLAILLRAVDRMWMISKEGLEKDLMDKVIKNKMPKTPQDQLAYNLKRLEEESELYNKFGGKIISQKEKSLKSNFFRNTWTLDIFKGFLRQWCEIRQIGEHKEIRKIFEDYNIPIYTWK